MLRVCPPEMLYLGRQAEALPACIAKAKRCWRQAGRIALKCESPKDTTVDENNHTTSSGSEDIVDYVDILALIVHVRRIKLCARTMAIITTVPRQWRDNRQEISHTSSG